MKTILLLFALVGCASAVQLCTLRQPFHDPQFSFDVIDEVYKAIPDEQRAFFATIEDALHDRTLYADKRFRFTAASYRCGLGTDPTNTIHDFFITTHPLTARPLLSATIEDRFDIVFLRDTRVDIDDKRHLFSNYHIACSFFSWALDIIDEEGNERRYFTTAYWPEMADYVIEPTYIVTRMLNEEQMRIGKKAYAAAMDSVRSGALDDEHLPDIMQCGSFSDAQLAAPPETQEELALQVCRGLRQREAEMETIRQFIKRAFVVLSAALFITGANKFAQWVWRKIKRE